MQSCHNWQRSQSWQRGWNASSLQVEDLRPRKMVEILCENIQFSIKEGKFFFHQLSQQFDALNSLILNVSPNSKSFSLSMIPSIGTFWLLFPKNQRKTPLCIWS